MAHLQLVSDLVPWKEYTIIELDGESCKTLRAFYETIADVMDFPDDFGFTIDSLDEMLENLSWMAEDKIAVYIKNSAHFLANERNENKKLTLLDRLAAVCEEWRWVEPDEDDFEKKELTFLFDESDNIRELLAKADE